MGKTSGMSYANLNSSLLQKEFLELWRTFLSLREFLNHYYVYMFRSLISTSFWRVMWAPICHFPTKFGMWTNPSRRLKPNFPIRKPPPNGSLMTYPLKTNGWIQYSKWWALEQVTPFKTGNFLVSMLDFWGVLFIHSGLCSLDGWFFSLNMSGHVFAPRVPEQHLGLPKKIWRGESPRISPWKCGKW